MDEVTQLRELGKLIMAMGGAGVLLGWLFGLFGSKHALTLGGVSLFIVIGGGMLVALATR